MEREECKNGVEPMLEGESSCLATIEGRGKVCEARTSNELALMVAEEMYDDYNVEFEENDIRRSREGIY